MLLQPTPVNSITHPLIASAYIKKMIDEQTSLPSKDVLVIETRTEAAGLDACARDDQWIDFLSDLDLIVDTIDRKGCKFDCVEIRRH